MYASTEDDDVEIKIRIPRSSLAALLGALAPSAPTVAGGYYTADHLPPGVPSKAAFYARCARIPAAVKDGRAWRVSIADYDAAVSGGPLVASRRAQPKAKAKKGEAPPANDSVAQLLAAGGYKLASGDR